MSPSCIVCGKTGKLCSGCKSTTYCGKDCQKEDWRIHRTLCKNFTALKATKQLEETQENRRLAILFPVEQKKPELIWVLINHQREEYGGLINQVQYEYEIHNEEVDLQAQLGEDVTDSRGLLHHIQTNDRRGHRLEAWLRVYSRADAFTDGSLPNRSIIDLTEGEVAYSWRGPVILVAKQEPSSVGLVRDVTLADLSNAVDYFRFYSRKNYTSLAGVQITCDGDLKAPGAERYEQYGMSFDQLNNIRKHAQGRPVLRVFSE